MTFIIGAVISFIFLRLVDGKKEGQKMKISFRFPVGDYYIHIHHWIWCSILFVILLIVKFQNQFIFGLIVGAIIQGLLFRDRFVVVYRKDKMKQIYSKFK